jgi:hypothetical protein
MQYSFFGVDYSFVRDGIMKFQPQLSAIRYCAEGCLKDCLKGGLNQEAAQGAE